MNMILDDYLMDEEKTEDDILDLVESKIPNIYFITPLLSLKNDEFQNRKYYDLFSKVLILRGEEKIKDIYPMLFFWLKDFNWPGSLQMREFLIRSDRKRFMYCIYQSIILAHDDKDDEWLGGLLSTLAERDSTKIGELCEYAIDTEEYEQVYYELLDLLEKDLDIKEYDYMNEEE